MEQRAAHGARPQPVDVQAPRWARWTVGVAASVIIGLSVVDLGAGSAALPATRVVFFGLLAALILRSRVTVDDRGVTLTQFRTRTVGWDDVVAFHASGGGWRSWLYGPHLEVRQGRPVPFHPQWKANGRPVSEIAERWSRVKRIPVTGDLGDDHSLRDRLLVVVMTVLGVLAGVWVAAST